MKKKNLLMTAVAFIGFATITIAQPVPSYVPTTGLVGWWPFNGNANDESGNNYNGTVNGASLTSDRYGYGNKAYFFNHSDEIVTNFNVINGSQTRTISFWMKNQHSSKTISPIWYGGDPNQAVQGAAFNVIFNRNEQSDPCNCWPTTYEGIGITADWIYSLKSTVVGGNQWHHWIVLLENLGDNFNQIKYFKDGSLVNSTILFDYNGNGINTVNTINLGTLKFGKSTGLSSNPDKAPTEFLDDIGVWNRALNQQEITALYNGCQLSVNSQPASQLINFNSNAQFSVGSSDPNATYQWQTDLGVGYQNLNNVGQYSGTTNDTLTVSNVTMSNNNQPFRCIISSGACTDTSNVAILSVNNNVGINEFTQDNLFSVYPNPAQHVINVKVDAKLLGSIYTVYDNTGKLVLSGKINSENTVIELGNLSGGIYLFSVGENLKQTFKVIKE
jgi:hypothetical protein